MILEGSCDIVVAFERRTLKGEEVEVLQLADGKALVIAHNALALFKHHSAIEDPLGGGLIDIMDLPEGTFPCGEAPKVEQHNAGFVGLDNGKVLLILPNAVKLYSNKKDALYNRSALASLQLSKTK